MFFRFLENGDVSNSLPSYPPGPSLETIGINDSQHKVTEKVGENEQANAKGFEVNLEEFSTDDLDEDEIDSYIVGEEEFERKQKAWSELYKTYLEEQKRGFAFSRGKKNFHKNS